MNNNQQVIMKGGKGFFDWLNDLYNSFFGSIFGYTDTVKLGGSNLKEKSKKRHKKTINNKRTNKNRTRKQ
jgi:hypothetical protein